MGALISRFFRKRQKSTLELLNDLDEKLRNIEEYGRSFDRKRRKIITALIIYSSAFYIVIASIVYLYSVPGKLDDQLLHVILLSTFSLLILISKSIITWYYRRRILKNREELLRIQTMKREILDEIFETEAFRDAREIIMKFGIDQIGRSLPDFEQTAIPARVSGNSINRTSVLLRETPTIESQIDVCTDLDGPASPWEMDPLPGHGSQNGSFPTRFRRRAGQLPRPILPQQRTFIEQFLEYVMSDGPSNRYALICRQCHSHNGMALKEEFEYFAFRCCYCSSWNPAKKKKPSAPKLDSSSQPDDQDFTPKSPQMMPDILGEDLRDDENDIIPSA